LRGIAASQGMVIASSSWGKYKTFFEGGAIFCLILSGEYLSVDFRQVGMVLLGIALILAIVSGVKYFKDFLREIII